MRVQDVIKSKGNEVITVLEDASIMEAVQIMQRRCIGALVVTTTDGRLRGVMSEREVVAEVARHGTKALDKRVRDLTLFAGPVVAPGDSVGDAMKIMTERRARHLPVVSGRSVIGLISIGDAVKARLFEKIAENAVLQDIARWPRAAVA
ncbi:MAG TPA: CBS domain-containing protein [Xanthobacteraceae bacterium]|nr:CBS domain-containing protein [Xanthobacteraceae bacterium]